MLEKIFAATIVAGCLVMLLRVVLGPRRRQTFDRGIARWSRRIRARLEGLFTWNSGRRRARDGAAGEWDGNVYRPKSFKTKKDRKIH